MSDPSAESSSRLRSIPQVDALLARAAAIPGMEGIARGVLLESVRALVDGFRDGVLSGRLADATETFDGPAFERAVRTQVAARLARRHVEVVNATGILLHTGLGRAPLCAAARDAAAEAARYAVVEVDPEGGQRDEREVRVAALLRELCGAEAATVVNNNAAATLLALTALAAGREAVVSRGQLVEIGGGFRMPDVMTASGATLREVGTTNRTHLADYAAAIRAETGLVLQVHTSNFRVVGFTAAPTTAELAQLCRERGVPLYYDLGSGLPRDVEVEPLADEPTVAAAVRDGADLVTFSGDKLLCGPQAGLVVGRADLVQRIRRHPLFRAVRPGKLDLAALEATLLAWRGAPEGIPPLPLYEALARSSQELHDAARRVKAGIGEPPGVTLSTRETRGFLGSGSAPAREFAGLAVTIASRAHPADALAARLRRGHPRVFARIDEDAVLLELRTIFPDQFDALCGAVRAALRASP